MATIVLIDAQALIHRSYHALPPLTSPKGEVVNAVLGFATVFLKMLRELKPTHVAACFDLPAPTFRHQEYDKYKATRPAMPDELARQIMRVKELLDAFQVRSYELAGFEADDLLGTIIEKTKNQKPKTKNDYNVIIVTGDLDMLQLVDKEVGVYTLRRGMQDTVLYDETAVLERYGLKPNQLADLRGLRGDASDNIPGVPGIGEKTASALLQEFGTLEHLYETVDAAAQEKTPKTARAKKTAEAARKSVLTATIAGKLALNKEQAFFSKYLATIRKDAPITIALEDIAFDGIERERVEALFNELGFRALLNRLPQKDGRKPPAASQDATQASLLAEAPPGTKDTTLKRAEPDIERIIEEQYRNGIFSRRIYEVERALVPIIARMERRGVLIDKAVLEEVGATLSRELARLQKEIYTTAGEEFNILSPQQLSKILFEKLAIPPHGMRKTPGGVISTQASELAKIRELHPVVPLIEEYRELAKLKSTYVDALPQLVDARDGRLHTTYKQLGAETGRLSSEEPNLQNIPMRSALGRKIRRAFIAPSGYKLLSADYSQIELRVAAVMSQDETLLEAFRRGDDIHTTTASQIFGVPEAEVTANLRRQAKVINFGVLYGMGIQGLAEAASISRSEAKDFIEKYFRSFPGVAKYVEETKRKARELGYVETLFGRKRYIAGLDSRDFRMRLAAERAAVNAPIQGTATADIIKMAMVALYQKLPIFNDQIHLLLQVHDELVFEVRDDAVSDVAPAIKKIMETVVEFPIPLVVDLKVGQNWDEMAPI
ncbi:MAG: DNA polymerase I [bacterium]|nr:DNA polymerase I [bacterium]MDZ4295966.1 DNA polymerase I [Patescibacteria group bacterium]